MAAKNEEASVKIEGHILIKSWSDEIGGSDERTHLNRRAQNQEKPKKDE